MKLTAKERKTIDDIARNLTTKQRGILLALADSFGMEVTFDTIYSAFYGSREFNVRPHIWAIRKALAGTNFKIISFWASGYALIKE